VDPVPFLVGALLVGTLCSSVHVFVRDGPGGFRALRGHTRYALLYGLLMAWGTLSHFLALRYLNETMMSGLAQAGVLLTIGLAVWWLGERFTRAEWFGALLVLAGLIAFRPWTGELPRLQGFLIVLTGALGGAIATVGAKRWVAHVPPRLLMVWRNATALVLVTAYAVGEGHAPVFTLPTALACVATGVLGPYLHGLFFLQALERIDASKAALVTRVQPAMVFFLAWVFLARVPEVPDIVSTALILLGALWLVRSRPAAPRAEREAPASDRSPA
jgi:drug/metabolite transporter (DMT)-like permease